MNELFEKGLKRRKATLSTDYVDNTMVSADKLNRPFQEAMTAWCWGFGWGDDVIDEKTRSMMNLAMIVRMDAKNVFTNLYAFYVKKDIILNNKIIYYFLQLIKVFICKN